MSTTALDRQEATVAELPPCSVHDSDMWFAESPADVELAKELCRRCPVRDLCLDGALERGEPWGVWGGELFLRGMVVPFKRPRGRPRKRQQAAQGARPAPRPRHLNVLEDRARLPR